MSFVNIYMKLFLKKKYPNKNLDVWDPNGSKNNFS